VTDPISGKLASQMAQQIQQMQEAGEAGGSQGASGSGGAGGASFQEVMQQQQAEAAQGVEGAQGAEAPQPIEQVEGGEEASRLENFVQDVMSDEKKIDEMMESCLNGGDMSQDEMLQMQSLIYGYSQKVDLATKVVEKAAGGVKQMMNTQV
jgi:hypothetical protein